MYDTDYYKGYFNFGFDSDKKNVLQFEHLNGERNRNEFIIEDFFDKIK